MAAPIKASRHLQCRDLREYLRTLPSSVLDKLYGHPATCIAIFRDLPILARHYVMRLLFVEQAVSQTVISAWVSAERSSTHTAAGQALSALRVWQEVSLPGGQPGWLLNTIFRANLKIALLGGGEPWTGAGALAPDKHSKDVEFLDQYAVERWECVLHYMVGSREGVSGVSRDVVDILLHAGLMKSDGADQEPYITPVGFQFLLMDTPAQVWYFMLQYLDTVHSRGMDLVECLTFLFQLSFSTTGKDYSTEGMSDVQQKFLQHLREFGLVYQRKRKSQRFYPTQLAINMAAAVSQQQNEVSTARQDGYIIVDTNFRIYAYTDSPLKVALLALFCEMLYRFPNMVVGQLTRDSVRTALAMGIVAEQMINFLRNHVHPEMKKHKPVLPPTISDQLRLWELERDRFIFSEGVLYNQFLSQTDFELLRDYAKDLDCLTWENPAKRVMVVTRQGHDDVKRFWKRHRNENS